MKLDLAILVSALVANPALALVAPTSDLARREPAEPIQIIDRDVDATSQELWKRRGGGGGGGRGGGGGGSSGSSGGGSSGGGGFNCTIIIQLVSSESIDTCNSLWLGFISRKGISACGSSSFEGSLIRNSGCSNSEDISESFA